MMKKCWPYVLALLTCGLVLTDLLTNGSSKEPFIALVCVVILAILDWKSDRFSWMTIGAYGVFAVIALFHGHFLGLGSLLNVSEDMYTAAALLLGCASITDSFREILG